VRVLRAGGIVAYPTEAVYGLGCEPSNGEAVARLLAVKRRSPTHGLILIAASFAQLLRFVEMPDADVKARVMASWPGHVSWALPAREDTPRWLTGEHPTLAVRVTGHRMAAKLCRLYGGALVSTSANRSGEPPARTAAEVRERLGREVNYVLPGRVGGFAAPSEIRDARDGRVLRPGVSCPAAAGDEGGATDEPKTPGPAGEDAG